MAYQSFFWTQRGATTAFLGTIFGLYGIIGTAAAQAGSDRFASSEVTLRLVAQKPDAGGNIRAALLVDLAPGWKTYWIDPGEAGLPPQIDFDASTNLSVATIAFPAPHRFGDAYATSNGYSAPMAVALTLRQTDPAAPTSIDAVVSLGVCATVCIPVGARLSLPEAAATQQDAVLVDRAFAALPAPSSATDRIVSAALSKDGQSLLVTATISASQTSPLPDLFVAGPKGWSFGKPTRSERRGVQVEFLVPVFGKPRKQSEDPLLIDVVATDGGAAFETHNVAVTRP